MDYKNEIEEYYCDYDSGLTRYQTYFSNGVVYDIPSYIFTEKKYAPIREFALFRMGFSVVTQKNCKEIGRIVGDGVVLEIMCGLAAYSATLRSIGIQCIPTDDMSWIIGEGKKYAGWKENAWLSEIEQIDAVGAIKKYGNKVDYILMSWPPQNDDVAYDALVTMRGVNKNCKMIYVGEWGENSCTANQLFFDSAIDISNQYVNVSELRNTYHSWNNDDYYDKQYILA